MVLIPMAAMLRHHMARKGAEAPAVTHEGETWSFGELEARANRRARLFADNGVKAGDFVTVAIPNSNEVYETSFAIWKLGATPNPVPSKLPAHEFQAIVDLVKPSLIVGGTAEATKGFNRIAAGTSADA